MLFLSVAGSTVTVAVPVAGGFSLAALVPMAGKFSAVTVIVCALDTFGASKRPWLEMVPALARQITAEFGELCTMAVNCRLAPVFTDVPSGETSIEARLLADGFEDVPALEVCSALWQAVMQRASATGSIRFTM